MRLAARQTFCKHTTNTRVQRAVKAATVQQTRFSSGYSLPIMNKRTFGWQWRGKPGTVVAVHGGTAWVAVQGYLYKHLVIEKSHWTIGIGEKQNGIEAVREHIPDLQRELGSKRAHDTTQEFPTQRHRIARVRRT
eukprot:2184281-Amphidinium_carterae.1